MSMMDDYEEYDDFDELEDLDAEPGAGEEQTAEGSGNRTFVVVAAIMGAFLILALVCMVVYAVFLRPDQTGREADAATIEAQNTSVALSSGMTAEAEAWTETPTITPTKAPATPTPTRTPVLAPSQTPVGGDASGAAAEPTADQRTATVSALLTAQAEMDLTVTPVPTTLPNSGFADDVGIPGLIALAAGLVVVIFLARRLRTAG